MTGPSSPPSLPPFAPGQTIGLYGGSFDPPHLGHLHVAKLALARLGLDSVWWLVTPANPLKSERPQSAQEERLDAVRALARHPRMVVADVETGQGVVYTVDTVRRLRRRCPGVSFVWIMGADSLAGFHRWRQWRAIAGLVPIAVVDRPGWTHKALRAPAALALARRRLPERLASGLARAKLPAWCFLYGPRSELSSSRIRTERRRALLAR